MSAPQRKSAERQALGSPRTCSCATWILQPSTRLMDAGWRSWRMVCHCGKEPSWPLTRPWSLLSGGMERPGQELQTTTVPLWMWRVGRRKPPTQSSRERGGRARLVVLAAEVGGRWNTETAQLLTALAKARAQEVPLLLQGRAEAACVRRWSAILACTAARALSVSLLDCRPAGGSEGAIPSVHEFMRDSRFL